MAAVAAGAVAVAAAYAPPLPHKCPRVEREGEPPLAASAPPAAAPVAAQEDPRPPVPGACVVVVHGREKGGTGVRQMMACMRGWMTRLWG